MRELHEMKPEELVELAITVKTNKFPDWEFKFTRKAPKTLAAWKDWVGEEQVVNTLNEYLTIRSQDRVRVARAGTTKRDPITDRKALLTIGQSYKPGTKSTQVTVVTKEGAEAFMTNTDDATFQEMYLKMQARAAEIEARLKAEAAKSTEPKTEAENAA